MTADPTPIPAAPTPYTHKQAAAIWGASAIEPDDTATAAFRDGMAQTLADHGMWPGPNVAALTEALLTPDSPSLPAAGHECGYEFREGLGYLAVDPNCPTCCEQATAKWKSVWKRRPQ